MFRFFKTAIFLVVLLTSGIAKAETFVFSDLGLAIDTPDGWAVLSASAGAEFLDGTNVTQDLKNMARDASNTQILSVIRENPAIGVSPGIHIHYWPGRVSRISDEMQNVIENLLQNVPNFVLIEDTTPDNLGAFDAAYISYRYEIISQGTPLQVVEKFWLVPMGDHYLTISTGVELDEGTAARLAIERSVHTLRRFP